MRKLALPALCAAATAALAGTAIAAGPKSHVMNVALRDGSVAHIEYVGNVPPKVTVAPAPMPVDLWTSALPPAGFGGMFEQMDRQMRAIEQMARQPSTAGGMNVASYGNLPVGASSVSVVSTSNGKATCTRTTQVVSQGPGRPPKVTSNVSGECGASAAPAQPGPTTRPSSAPLDHT